MEYPSNKSLYIDQRELRRRLLENAQKHPRSMKKLAADIGFNLFTLRRFLIGEKGLQLISQWRLKNYLDECDKNDQK